MVIEIGIYKLVDGVDDQQFLKILDAFQSEFLAKQAGFTGKHMVSKGEDGRWVEMVFWNTMDNVQKATENVMADPAAQPLIQAIDMNNMEVLQVETLREW
jgi:hypothetical protein